MRTRWTLPLLSTTLFACGSDEPPKPHAIRSALRDDLGHVLREGYAATELTAALPTGSAFGFATMALGAPADAATARVLAPVSRLLAPRARTLAFDEEAGGLDTDAIVDTLEHRLFTDANYLGNGIYRVPASLVCEEQVYDPITGEPTSTTIDPECAQRLAQAQLRVRVEGDDDELRFFIQIAANHDEPLGIRLAHDALAITLDFDEATDALIALAPLFGEPAPNAELTGAVTGSLTILGTAHARIALAFDRAISIKVAEQAQSLDGPAAFRFASAAGEILGVELDASAPRGRLDLGLGATTVHVPGDSLDPALDVVLGGATVNATLQGNTLALANLSLGTQTTTMSVGGQQAIAIDLNPGDGRSLDAKISVDPVTGAETLEVSPRLDLHSAIDHAVLGDEAPVYDVTRVQLDGSLRGSALGDHIEVVTGSLSITTNPAQYGMSASAGQCVQATAIYDGATFTSYTQYAVVACP